MEENYQENNQPVEEKKHICFEDHCWKKCLAMVIAAFLGGFLACYFAADQMFERMEKRHFEPHRFEKRMLKDIDRMYKQDKRAFNDAFDIEKMYKQDKKAFEDAFNPDRMKKIKHPPMPIMPPMPDFMWEGVKIKSEIDDNMYKVTIGLKPFQDDENKVNYNVNGRKLTVFGSSSVKDKHSENDISFSQDFILPDNADIANISKIKKDHKLIISVPIKM